VRKENEIKINRTQRVCRAVRSGVGGNECCRAEERRDIVATVDGQLSARAGRVRNNFSPP